MKLVVFSHFRCEERDGKKFITGGFGPQLDELSKYFSQVDIVVLRASRHVNAYRIKSNNINMIYLDGFDNYGLFGGLFVFLRKLNYYRKSIMKIIENSSTDTIFHLFNNANYVGTLATSLVKRSDKPHFIRYITDWPTEFRISKDHPIFRKLLSPIICPILAKYSRNQIKGSVTIYTGEIIHKDLPRQYSVVSSSLKLSDIVKSDHSCKSLTYKILYVGALGSKKGIDDLIKAVANLATEGKYVVQLDIIGAGPQEHKLRTLVKTLKMKHLINFLGQVQFGPKLFKHYLSADMVVVPSLWEGLPKTSFEPKAFGTPVIATKVASIPKYITHEKTGLLVEPGNPDSIKKAVICLIENASLRKKIIRESYKQVKTLTVEHQAETTFRILKNEILTKIKV